jgi:primosomal protein N' (replication factor Y)
MVAKGHDVPGVTLVGVIAADLGLHFPDFRAGERTFQLLTQVAGRAGRGDDPGRVVIQTFLPQHYAIALAKTHDYPRFYREEIARRRPHGWPPFRDLVQLALSGSRVRGQAAAVALAGLAKTVSLDDLDGCGRGPRPRAAPLSVSETSSAGSRSRASMKWSAASAEPRGWRAQRASRGHPAPGCVPLQML